jgi:hypothetical protein
MPTLLVIRLHPAEPVTGDAFTSYLTGLTIAAHELSFSDPAASAAAFGTASYLAPQNLGSLPPLHDPNTRIIQHFGPNFDGLPIDVLYAVGTAVIEIPDPPAGGEFRSADIRLVLTRGGDITHKQRYFNVPVAPAPLPADPTDYQSLPVSLHLALPAPGQQVGQTVVVPEDGSAPNFNQLRTAVEQVLLDEPGTTNGIADLTLEQCRHIAYEIIWDRLAFPLPTPNRPLDAIYTGPQDADSDDERDRRIFEGDLLTYYVKHNTEAERLTNFVFALSAAIWCEEQSEQATRATFSFPVFPAAPAREVQVVLTGSGPILDPAFQVPAAYFYALTAILPPQVKREQRFSLAAVDAEAQTIATIDQAIEDNVLVEPAGVNRFQAARRLRALSATSKVGMPICIVTPATAVHTLIGNWLAFAGAEITAFWIALSVADTNAHLDVLLCAITMAPDTTAPLVVAITNPPFSVSNVTDLAAKTTEQWQNLLHPNPALLPEFTKPGTTEERTQAFIRHLRSFFDVTGAFASPAAPDLAMPPFLDRPGENPIDRLLSLFPGFDFSNWDAGQLATALANVFPGDSVAQQQFTAWLRCIQDLITLTNSITPPELQFSVMEALWARGFVNQSIIYRFNLAEFQQALAGSVAYNHATTIWTNAGAVVPQPVPPATGFIPINPDGSLVNCIPAAHLSPLGPVAYLHELLHVSALSTCDDPLPPAEQTLATLLEARRGPLANLLASKANLDVPIPLIDIVNECLEYMVANGTTHGAVYDTAPDQIDGHELTSHPNPTHAILHEPEVLLAALPEHATPAVLTAEQEAYTILKSDFSACMLPYSQPLDVARRYLQQLGSSRYATMRHFRSEITEFVLAPEAEPAAFQRHLWRLPVRIDTAIEYLGITPEEYQLLFQNTISNAINVPAGKLALYQLYGFAHKTTATGQDWTSVVVVLSEFLERTCLRYCEFIELWQSEFVRFGLKGQRETGFPLCEPCCLDQLVIEFFDPANAAEALKRLIVFIRLWRKLRHVPNAGYSFHELRDICEVLQLFDGTAVHLDFIRQLAAFQLLRDQYQLGLRDSKPVVAGTTGAERTHLLAFWVPGASHGSWVIEHLLYQIQRYAITKLGCVCREPEFLKLLQANLMPLSELVGFDSANPAHTWHARPTHTLRLAEVLTKIYASKFHVGELLFLFTNSDHLQGDDPFPLQTVNEAKDSPLGLPDDEDEHSLWALRNRLRAIIPDAERAAKWTWAAIEERLQTEYGFRPTPADWLSLGQHFFAGALAESGIVVTPQQRQYQTPLLGVTAALMWNTPPGGPFQYQANTLSTQLPLTDEAVIAKLSRIRQLTNNEASVVRELYFMPRRDLAHVAFLFENLGDAEEHLIQEPDESLRWAWFQQQFDCFDLRCQAIAKHLADHIAAVTTPNTEGIDISRLLLRHLWADENFALTPWEDITGQPPQTTWQPQPRAGAYAALLGLLGTGMPAEYRDANQALRWREIRGGLEAFGPEENAANAPIPTILPSFGTTLNAQQLRFIAVRNGFAMANSDGAPLGGAEPFTVTWKGLVLIEQAGAYAFSAGAPTASGVVPDFEQIDQSHRWRITLKRGQRTWILLAHNWPAEEAPAACTEAIQLRRGFYELTIEIERLPFVLDGPEDVCPQHTGFQLKYSGPDSADQWAVVPHDKLFQELKNTTLQAGIREAGAAAEYLAAHYTSSIRDIRRSYQRIFKAGLLANQLRLSAQPVADDGQSELGYILAHADRFAGFAYFHDGVSFTTHKAFFDLNFLPVLDSYAAPTALQDQRSAPSTPRSQAMFDWWERLHDYTVMRREAERSPEDPAWLVFHESAEVHPDDPADLVRHLGIDIRHNTLVLRYFNAVQLTSDELMDDRWVVRVWQAEKWIRQLLKRFYPLDIRAARPDLWASDDPATLSNAFGTIAIGNHNLATFYRDGCIEQGDPRRYREIEQLNDALRLHGRDALVAYLTRFDRVALPWGGFANTIQDLSELLLLDVAAELCQKASRIEEAISAVQLFVQRARLGLEPGFSVTAAFILAWDRHFATFRIWEACKRREIYQENWIEWDDLYHSKQSEAFTFLESELRRATLTMPVPGGLAYWSGPRPAAHPGVSLLQHREPATIARLNPAIEGLGLRGTPDRHARPSWLAPLANSTQPPRDPPADHPDRPRDPEEPDEPAGGLPVPATDQPDDITLLLAALNPGQAALPALPMWLQAAVRLGAKFIRVAAAGIPPATTTIEPGCATVEYTPCCEICGKPHAALMDEYYFWLEPGRRYEAQEQIAEWGATAEDLQTDWHRPEQLPGLLHWETQPTVYLHWCRVHNGEFQPPRTSSEAVHMVPDAVAQLIFIGRTADSLRFEVSGASTPVIGYAATPAPGFRYDLATDQATTLPEVVVPDPIPLIGGLTAFPYFGWFDPGAPLVPPSRMSVAIAIAGQLRAHCRFEAALKWYETVYHPLHTDNRWTICPPVSVPSDGGEVPPGSTPIPGTPSNPPVPVPSTVPPRRDANGCCCASEPVSPAEARERALLLHYLETLLQWGEAVLQSNTPERFQQARVLFEAAARILGSAPISVQAHDDTIAPVTLAAFQPACAPINPRLLCLYSSVTDRLALIHHCLNSWRLKHGKPNRDMPYFGNSNIRECWQTPDEGCADEGEWCLPHSPYRFVFLVQKAQEVTGDVRGMGSALLAAYEKGDGEYLAAMRAMHERQLHQLALEIRQQQWREADWQTQALRKTKEMAQTRLQYYSMLIAAGLIVGEAQYEPLTISSTTLRSAGNIVEAIGQAMNLIPDPNVGFPVSFLTLPPGKKLAMIFSAAGKISNTLADIVSSVASLGLTKAGWERREQEWKHQVNLITIEIEQIERQILAAERRRDAALRELNNQQRLFENAGEVHDYLRDKFTNHGLFLWMQQETAALYRQLYELALHCSHQAQRAFNYERGHLAQQFIPGELWDNLHEGLLAGERLQLALHQMEKSYYSQNLREYELSKTFSLRQHFPLAFLQLQVTGKCEIDIPEWMFDHDYPGQYMRRIKNVALTIPAVVGPYTGVHCRLTLLSSRTRVDARLLAPPHTCCDDTTWHNAYTAQEQDTRFVDLYAATEAIATSDGENDTGMFELNFRDERYLPFEYAGAISRWRIELPQANNFFAMETLSDLMLQLNFTAREGGDILRAAAHEAAQRQLPGDGIRFLNVRNDLPDAWYGLTKPQPSSAARLLGVRLSRQMFPFIPGNAQLGIQRIALLFEAPEAHPSAHHTIEFLVGQRPEHIKEEKCDCDMYSVECIADAEWPGLFHGVLDVDLGVLGTKPLDLGVFRFPATVGEISNAYLFCWYEQRG